MTWHTPMTWVVDQLVTETDLNTQLRDNLTYLKERVDDSDSAIYSLNETADYATTSSVFVDIDATKLAFTLNTQGGAVLVGFCGTVHTTSTGDVQAYFDLSVNGVRVAGDDGLYMVCRKFGAGASLSIDTVGFVVLLNALPSGTHSIKLQWRVTGGNINLRGGTGLAGHDLHGQFWAQEL